MTRSSEIEKLVLSPEEIEEAIYEGKLKKFWAEKNKDNPQLKEPEVKGKNVGSPMKIK